MAVNWCLTGDTSLCKMLLQVLQKFIFDKTVKCIYNTVISYVKDGIWLQEKYPGLFTCKLHADHVFTMCMLQTVSMTDKINTQHFTCRSYGNHVFTMCIIISLTEAWQVTRPWNRDILQITWKQTTQRWVEPAYVQHWENHKYNNKIHVYRQQQYAEQPHLNSD